MPALRVEVLVVRFLAGAQPARSTRCRRSERPLLGIHEHLRQTGSSVVRIRINWSKVQALLAMGFPDLQGNYCKGPDLATAQP